MSAPWLVIQHVAWEGPGLIAQVAESLGIALSIVRVDLGEQVPHTTTDLNGFEGVVVMGGPMSVNDAASLPYLDDERRLLSAAAAGGRPVLGVCLGAQLLAAALGGRVFRGPAPEVGFGAVRLTPAGASDPVLGPGPLHPVFHWHGETFDLPPGAVLLASSERYAHQAFRFGSCAYGFQFHVEVTAVLADAWAPHLPGGVSLKGPDREKVERAGRHILGRFFEAAEQVRSTRTRKEKHA